MELYNKGNIARLSAIAEQALGDTMVTYNVVDFPLLLLTCNSNYNVLIKIFVLCWCGVLGKTEICFEKSFK